MFSNGIMKYEIMLSKIKQHSVLYTLTDSTKTLLTKIEFTVPVSRLAI